jgi:hypothetical protein
MVKVKTFKRRRKRGFLNKIVSFGNVGRTQRRLPNLKIRRRKLSHSNGYKLSKVVVLGAIRCIDVINCIKNPINKFSIL